MRSCEQPHSPIAEEHAHTHAGTDHAHSHTHAHSHASWGATEHRPRQRRALLACMLLTAAAMLVELAGGIWTGSLMLLSDAAHMLSHALALGVSYVALRLAGRSASERSHYGFYRAEILGAFLNGVGLFALTGWIVYEAVRRFLEPVQVPAVEMTAVAVLGLAVNLATAWILVRAGAQDLNTRSALLHMLGDTVSSVAIVAGGVFLWATGAAWIDPLLSLVVAGMILLWSTGLLRQSAGILLELAPREIDAGEVRRAILGQVPGVLDVHDVHVWEITSGYVCLTAHVVVDDGLLSATHEVRERVCALVRTRFRVAHATLQIETSQHAASPA